MSYEACAICGQSLFGDQQETGACAGGCAEKWNAEVGADVDRMISASVAENKIVHSRKGAAHEAEVGFRAEGSADGDAEREYWGTTDDGDEWRIHFVKGGAQ